MDKTEAIREWCIEKAVELFLSNGQDFKVEDVVRHAKELEKYIRGD